MCRQADVRRHDGLRAEGRSPCVGLRGNSLRTAEKTMWGRKKNWGPKKAENVFGGVEKVIWPPNTITRRRRKNKQTRFFRLGAEKYNFRAPKEQRPILIITEFLPMSATFGSQKRWHGKKQVPRDLLQNENVPLFTNYNIITFLVFY